MRYYSYNSVYICIDQPVIVYNVRDTAFIKVFFLIDSVGAVFKRPKSKIVEAHVIIMQATNASHATESQTPSENLCPYGSMGVTVPDETRRFEGQFTPNHGAKTNRRTFSRLLFLVVFHTIELP